jgi:phage-related protein
MADNLKDVLQINIDLANWGEQLNQMASMYAEKISSLPKLELGNGDLSKGIEQINASINNLVNGMHESMSLLSETMHETANAVEQVTAKVDEAGKSGGNFNSLFGGGLLSSIASTARFYAQWQLVSILFQGLEAIIAAPFKALNEGFDRISSVAERSAQLQGVIASTLILSKDLGTNFRIAGEQATVIVNALEDIAAKTGLDETQITKAFKALLEGGGGAFVTDMKQLVDLTELFGLAIVASGKGVEATRSLVSQLPKLLDNTIAAHAPLLEVLGLTKEKWTEIREQGLLHKDLLERLEPLMKDHLSVVDQAGLRWKVIVEQMGLLKERTEATIAGPLYAQFLNILEQIKNYFDTHAEQIRTIATEMGKLLGVFTQLSSELLHQTQILPALVEAFAVIAGSVGAIANSVTHLSSISQNNKDEEIENAEAFKKRQEEAHALGADNGTTLSDANKQKNIQSETAYQNALDAISTKYTSKRTEEYQRFTNQGDALYNQTKKVVDDLNKLNDPREQDNTSSASSEDSGGLGSAAVLGTKHGPGSDESKAAQNLKLQQLKDFYKQESDAVKLGEDEIRNNISRAEADKTLSVTDGETQRKQSYDTEKLLLQGVADSVKQHASTLGLDPKQAEALANLIKTSQDAETNKAQHSDAQSDEKISADHIRSQEETFKADLARAELLTQQKLALAKKAEAEGLISHEAAVNAEIEATRKGLTQQIALRQEQLDHGNAAGGALANGPERTRIEEQIATLQLSTGIKLNALGLDLIIAKQRDRNEELAHYERLRALELQRVQNSRAAAQDNGQNGPVTTRALDIEEAQAKLNEVAQQASDAGEKFAQALAASGGLWTPAVVQAADAADKLRDAAQAAADHLASLQGFNVQKGLAGIFGGDVGKLTDPDAGGLTKFGVGLEAAGNALKTFSNIVGAVQQGISQGGVLGGIGGGLGAAGGLVGSFNPIAGAAIQGVGEIFSFIGGIFSNASKKLAAEIEKEIKGIEQSYQNGQTNLIGTINALQQEKQNAISQLSGVKGGQDQLDKILPALDQQIAQLTQQATAIRVAFDSAVKGLQLGGGELTTWNNTWTAINKQVRDYLDAGGSLSEANNFLSLSLKQQEKTLQDSLEEGEHSAIADAIKLNDLIKQRQQMIDDQKQAEFSLLTKDSLEKRQSQAVLDGQAITKQKKADADKLNDLNDQINLVSQQLGLEKSVFTIATDIAALKQRSNAIELDQLNQQLDKYRQMQDILQKVGAFQFASNQHFGNGFIPGVDPKPVPPVINVNLPLGWNGNGRQLASDLVNELNRQGRTLVGF